MSTSPTALFGENARTLAVLLACIGLVGCGLVVPNVKEAWDQDRPEDPIKDQPKVPGAALIEWAIKKRVYCDLRRAVRAVNLDHPIPVTESSHGKVTKRQPGLIPNDWQAQVSLSLQVDEASSLSPGVAVTQLLPNATHVFGPGNSFTTSQSASLALGGTLSSTATRIDKFDPYYSVASMTGNEESICDDPKKDYPYPFQKPGFVAPTSSPFIIESDLGIDEWVKGAMIVNSLLPSTGSPPQALGAGGGKGAPAKAGAGKGANKGSGNNDVAIDTITYEVKFIIISSGNVTPTWKLIQVSANTAGSFLSSGRTRTHDLIITLGPPTAAASQTHFASQLGNAINNANRPVTPITPSTPGL